MPTTYCCLEINFYSLVFMRWIRSCIIRAKNIVTMPESEGINAVAACKKYAPDQIIVGWPSCGGLGC